MSFRLPALQIFTLNDTESFALNAEKRTVWKLHDKDVVVGDYRILGVYNTAADLHNQMMVRLLRFSSDPINGFYNYVRHIRDAVTDKNYAIVHTDKGNASLTLHDHSNGKPEIYLLDQPKIYCASFAVREFVRRRMEGASTGTPLSAKQTVMLLEMFTHHLGWDKTAIPFACEPLEEGNPCHGLIKAAFGDLPAAEIELIAEGLWHRVAKEMKQSAPDF